MQFMMNQWLDLQRSQQRVAERFLDVQERMLLCSSSGIPMQPVQYRLTPPAAAPAPAAVMAPPMVAMTATAPVSVPAPAPALPAAHVACPAPAPTAAAPVAVRPPVPVPAEVAAPPKPTVRVAPAAEPAKALSPAARIATPPAGVSDNHSKGVATAASTNGAPPTEAFRNDLLEAVSERTGYPVDMLDEDLPLESGLGIDSIKTVEIFSNLKTYHAYFRQDDQDEEELLTEFTKLKTLGDIVRSYDTHRQAFCTNGSENGKAASAEAAHSNGRGNGSVQSLEPPMERLTLEAVEISGPSDSEKKNSPRAISS
jgi:acyl carrier protein